MAVRLATALAFLLLFAASAEARRSVPVGFFGVAYDTELRSAPLATQALAWRRISESGAESARTVFSWAHAQPSKGAEFDHRLTDLYVRGAALYGARLLPIVMGTPDWAAGKPDPSRPSRYAPYGEYLRSLIRRYGPGGRFWKQNPSLPERPIREWQIFNEPGKDAGYAALLRGSYRTIKKLDRGAKVVMAGLTGTFDGTPWDVLEYQYKRGIKGYFDVATVHMYTGKPSNVLKGIQLFRRVMARHGDARKALWLTEFGKSASRGKTDAPDYQDSLRTTDEGMAVFLRDTYRLLMKNRRRSDVLLGRAYWYTFASNYRSGESIFRFSGLWKYYDGEWDAKPALAEYRSLATSAKR